MADDCMAHADKPKENSVCFAEAVAEELIELDVLRKKRGMMSDPAQGASKGWREVNRIGTNAGATKREDKDPKLAAAEATAVVAEARKMKLAGLAFSGGGIRSATFNLGVLQGLAQYNKVRSFDYLSTVSGGGYIGSWLESWIFRDGQKLAELPEAERKGAICYGIDVVEEELRPARTARTRSVNEREWTDEKSHTEPPQVRFLRDYSNYLTPRLGAMGADTWTVIAIYLRNLLLNQTLLILTLFAMLLLPYAAAWLTQYLPKLLALAGPVSVLAAPFTVFALMSLAMSFGALNIRELIDPRHGPKRGKPWNPPQEQFWVIMSVVVPILVAAWVLTTWLWPQAKALVGSDAGRQIAVWASVGTVLLGGPITIGSLILAWERHSGARGIRMLWWVLESLATGAVSGLLMLLVVRETFEPMSGWYGERWHELSLGVPLALLVFLAAGTIQVGLMGRTFSDPYREWWARVGGWLFILGIAWTAGASLAFYAPLGLLWLRGWLAAAGLTWIANTATGVLAGKSDKTGSLDAGGTRETLLSLTPYLFIVGLASLLSLSLELLLARCRLGDAHVAAAWSAFLAESPAVANTANAVFRASGSLHRAPGGQGVPEYVTAHFTILSSVTHWWLVLAWAGLAAFCLWLSWRVDLNEFSMNLMYRNRLVRCYLGATHEGREPNPFSGLDCGDDLLLSTVRSSGCYSGPLPILNATLNLVDTRDLAWQERKAESFPMTPLRCGFDTWLEQADLDRSYEREKQRATISKYAYRPTWKYAYPDGGFYMGTAVSISGAAASPNMGYHSTPSLAILMTFFNVRLGFWSGNPRNDETWFKPGPTVGLRQLMCELFGLTNDNAKYIYLSDGGHFENLGIYELVKRRCKYIVACDAGADPKYTFEDLGNAIRKCREDIGVEIEVDTDPLIPKGSSGDDSKSKDGDQGDDKKRSQQHCVAGTIRYDLADPLGEPGVFVYVKASLTGDEPPDVLNYQTAHPAFPHESTADQWFSESQFESYRRLGQHVIEAMFAGPPNSDQHEDLTPKDKLDAFRSLSTEALFASLQEKWREKKPQKPAEKKPQTKKSKPKAQPADTAQAPAKINQG